MDEKAGLGQDSARRTRRKRNGIYREANSSTKSIRGRSRFGLFSNLRRHGNSWLAKSEGWGVREGATRHEDEMDGDKASALDVYLRFKLSPARPEERKFCRSLIFSLGLSWVAWFFFFFSTKEDPRSWSTLVSLAWFFFLLYKGNYNLLLRSSERQHSFETACTSVISLQGSIFAWRSVSLIL